MVAANDNDCRKPKMTASKPIQEHQLNAQLSVVFRTSPGTDQDLSFQSANGVHRSDSRRLVTLEQVIADFNL
jgi:hypothetical protein